jgi:hypothetical protein
VEGKTIAEWLAELEEPYKSQSLQNDEYSPYRTVAGDERKHLTIKKALLSAFVWDETKEGDEYWREFHDLLK